MSSNDPLLGKPYQPMHDMAARLAAAEAEVERLKKYNSILRDINSAWLGEEEQLKAVVEEAKALAEYLDDAADAEVDGRPIPKPVYDNELGRRVVALKKALSALESSES